MSKFGIVVLFFAAFGSPLVATAAMLVGVWARVSKAAVRLGLVLMVSAAIQYIMLPAVFFFTMVMFSSRSDPCESFGAPMLYCMVICGPTSILLALLTIPALIIVLKNRRAKQIENKSLVTHENSSP